MHVATMVVDTHIQAAVHVVHLFNTLWLDSLFHFDKVSTHAHPTTHVA